MLDRPATGVETPGFVTVTLGEQGYFRRPESRVVAMGEALFEGGLATAQTARIVEGAVCLHQQAGDGGRCVIDILGPGHLVGSFLTGLAACNVTALAPTRLAAVTAVAAADEAAQVAEATRVMLGRAQAHALLLRRNAVAERVASCLLDLARQFGDVQGEVEGETTFMLHLTRGELADWLGLTLTSVSRGLNAFKRAGLIAFDHPKLITIRDHAGLTALASGEPARRRLTEAASAARRS